MAEITFNVQNAIKEQCFAQGFHRKGPHVGRYLLHDGCGACASRTVCSKWQCHKSNLTWDASV